MVTLYYSVETVIISPQNLTVPEGNNTMNTTQDLCVILSDAKSGVQREVIVNISATEEIATGSYYQLLYAKTGIIITLYVVRMHMT